MRNLIEFKFLLSAPLVADRVEVLQWLTAEVDAARYDSSKQQVVYPTDSVYVQNIMKMPFKSGQKEVEYDTTQRKTYLEVMGCSSLEDQQHPLHWANVLVLVQDIFCVLERRGFQIQVDHAHRRLHWR